MGSIVESGFWTVIDVVAKGAGMLVEKVEGIEEGSPVKDGPGEGGVSLMLE
jgi:hypothetical protein